MPKKNSTGTHGVLSAEPRVHQKSREIQPYGSVTHAFHLELEQPHPFGNNRTTQSIAGRFHDSARSV